MNRRSCCIIVSAGGIRSIWLRHDLATFQKRLKAKLNQDGIKLTDEQMAALERAKAEKQAHREIETPHFGYLRAK